jgi:pimeloyl-ACP methyl ester carboxylesterase
MGRSGVPAGFNFSLEHMAGFVDGVVTALGIDEPLNLIVHDFGGPYGLAWAVRHPAKIRSMAIMNTNFSSSYRWHPVARIWRTPVLGELSLALTSRWLWHREMRKTAPTMPAAYIERTYNASIARPEVRRTILRMYRATDPDNYKGWEGELLKLTARVPALVLWGDRDPFITPDRAERFGAGKVEHIAGYGHWLPVEAPELVAERLLAFFEQ